MKNFIIDAKNQSQNKNCLEIEIPSNLGNLKIVDAILNIKVATVSTGNNFIVNYSAKIEDTITERWNNVDSIKDITSSQTLLLNISDELQDAIDQKASSLIFEFKGNNDIVFDDSVRNFINVDYITLSEYQANSSYHNINLNKSGKGYVDIATGKLNINVPLVPSDDNVLPLSINANYNSLKNDKLPDVGLPKNWNLNVNQFLIKEDDENGNLKFTYIDENGKSQIIEEKYYYLDETDKKIYVTREHLEVDLDGNYIYVISEVDSDGENINHVKKIKTELTAPSGLKLVSSIHDIESAKLVDYEPEELRTQREKLIIYQENKDKCEQNLKIITNQIINNALTKHCLINQLKIQDYNLTLSSEEIEYNKLVKIHKENLLKDSTKSQPPDTAMAETGFEYPEEKIAFIDYSYAYGEEKKYVNFDFEGYNSIKKSIYDLSKALSTKLTQTEFVDSISNCLPSDFYNYAIKDKIENIWTEYTLSLSNIKTEDIDNVKFSFKDLYYIDTQINSAILEYQICIKDIDKLQGEIKILNHSISFLESQVPVHYLYNDNNVIFGFGKTFDEENKETNIYRLILISDAYENAIYITYDSLSTYKIKSITDSAEKSIIFEYDYALLKSITDSRDRKVLLTYKNQNLSKIKHIGEIESYYFYDNNSNIIATFNKTGIGASFTYKNEKIEKVTAISLLEKVENGKLTYKEYDSNNNESLKDNLDFENLQNFNIYEIANQSITFDYQNYKSTTLTNNNGKIVTYLLDKKGIVRTIYENNFQKNDDNFEDNYVNATEFIYEDNKINKKISKLPYSQNYLEDVVFDKNKTKTEEGFYLGCEDAICSATTIPYNYLVNAKYYTVLSVEENKTSKVSMTPEKIMLLNSAMCNNVGDESVEAVCSHRTFVVSGWAKADSAFITDKELQNDNNSEIYPNYIKNRKFEIRAKIKYVDNDEDIFTKTFDWRNTEWQYCALAFTLQNKIVAEIECYVDYFGNTGDIQFTDLQFNQGDFECTEYDSQKRQIKVYSAHSNYVTTYEYENDKTVNPSKQIIINKFDTNKKYVTTYEYTKNGKFLRSVDYNGIVKENVYNDKGAVVKTMTYNKYEPASKYYEEHVLDEKGNENQSVNEFGDKVAFYERVEGTGLVQTTIDENGVKTSYGYASDDTLLETSTNVDGINNTNTFGYNLDFLTSLKHNNFSIDYDYDGQGRNTKISIAGNEYLSKTYAEKEDTTILGTSEKYRQTFDNNGNVSETFYTPKGKESQEQLISQNIYDTLGNLVTTKDYTNGENINKVFIDKFGKTYKSESDQHSTKVAIENQFDANHDKTIASSISIDNEITKYEFVYSDNPDSRLEAIAINKNEENGTATMEQTTAYDKLGRPSLVSNNIFSKEYQYLSNGDHTSNLISKLQFAIDGVNKDNLSYKYDSKGNITEVRENNNLIARYQYDALSRIIREDNSIFNKTTTFTYDSGGNITQRKEYEFTLIENLDFKTPISTFDYVYPATGWKDQLMEYKGEKFAYDEIGNPITYRNKTLVWSHGRQLDKFDDIAEYTYNANGIRTSKTFDGFTTKFYLNGNKILKQHDASNNLTFYYGAEGVTGFHIKNNVIDADFFYKKNTQNDVIGIYNSVGTEIVRYSYDAWGNEKCQYLSSFDEYIDIEKDYTYNDISIINRFIATKNPFRYRSYYYDFETGLYYLNSRYYDPQLGRFINADDISALDVTQISLNGLNLYAYCLNNPINDVDNEGNVSWWQWLLFGIGALLVVAAAVVLAVASGGAALGLLGTIAVGAAKGALIGAAIGSVAGIAGGAIYSAVTGADLGQSILSGFLIGFGAGAIVGAVIGGSVSGAQFISASKNWAGGSRAMMSHFNKHGLSMGYKNPVQYTKAALQVIKNGNYLKAKNAFAVLINANKYNFVGVIQGGTKITTFSIRTFTKVVAKILGLIS